MKVLIFIIALIGVVSSLSTRGASGAATDDMLFCHGVSIYEPHETPSGSDYSYLMNTTAVLAGATATDSQDVTFTSPALVSLFTYGVVNVTVYHTQIAEADSVQLHVAIGHYDDTGYHAHNVQISDYLDVGSTVSSLSILDITPLLAGQRLWVRAYLNIGYSVIWGDATHNTQISYEGTADYVPEFPSLLTLLLFVSATLLGITFYRRKIERSINSTHSNDEWKRKRSARA